jgi:hypothetical protein
MTTDYFFLVFNRGVSEVAVSLSPRSYGEFDPDAHRPEAAVAELEMLEGVAVQDSGIIYGGQTITVKGECWSQDQVDLINSYYLSSSRPDVTYRDTRQTAVEEWPVVIKSFKYTPYFNRPGQKYKWTLELVTLGKYDTDGETILP